MILPALVIVAFLAFAAAYQCGLRIAHHDGQASDPSWDGVTVGLTQLLVWTVACAMLFGILRFATMVQASPQEWIAHFYQGGILALTAVIVTITPLAISIRPRSAANLLRAIGVWAISLGMIAALNWTQSAIFTQSAFFTQSAIFGGPAGVNRLLFHPGGSHQYFIATEFMMVLLGAINLRRNGYRLSWRPPPQQS